MGQLIVRCDTGQNLASLEREIRDIPFVTGFSQYLGLKKLALVTHTDGPGHKNDVRNALYHLAPVYGVLDGDQSMVNNAQETVGLTESRTAFDMPVQFTQKFHMWDKRPGAVPWTQRPRATSFQREQNRKGSNIIVSVHDSGVDSSHTTEFGARVTQIYNDAGDGPGVHGTGVASIIAGANSGFLPEATILDSKCFSANNVGGVTQGIESLDALITWVQANLSAGDHVIANCSFGSTNEFGNDYATITDDVEAEGIAMFAASGNFGWNLDTGLNFWPAEGLLHGACGAVNMAAEHLNFSNYGSMVKLHGLGWKVPCATLGNGNYTNLSGTSFGCPSVAGAYGTWATSREAPRSQSEVRQLMGEYVDFCQQGRIRVRENENPSLATKACVAKADNSPA